MSGAKVAVAPIGKTVLMSTWVLLGGLPIFSKMVGIGFVPSIKWMAISNLLGVAAGVVSAALMLWLVLKSVAKTPVSGRKKFCGVVGAPLLGYLVGRNIAVLVGPMAIALIAGQQVELPFTVAYADRVGTRGCRSPIELQGLPFLFDRLCGVPNDIRLGFGPGSQVIVTGRGTTFGVYPESLRRVDE